MSEHENGSHLLIFPYPAQGHMLPLLDLTHQLAQRGLMITIVITQNNLPILNPLLLSNPSIHTLVFPFPDHPDIPHGVENIKDLGNHGNIPMIHALSKFSERIIQWFESHDNPPVALMSDVFLGWTHHLARQIGIPRLVFYSLSALLTAIFDYLWNHAEEVRPGSEVRFQDIPRCPSFKWDHVPTLFRRYRESEPDESRVLLRESMVANGLGWATVINTFEGLESGYLEYLRKNCGHNRVFSVGPLNLLGGPNENGHKSVPFDDTGVWSWLGRCPDESVLYVCFGSQKLLRKAQVETLATALEKSGVRFVWVVKPLTTQQVADGYGSIPDGFEGQVGDRGFVIKGWAPQVPILSHRAVAGFLSHCGWNSVLDAMTAGVMIMGWPMEADQFVNAKLLVDDLGAAIRVCEGADTVPDPGELTRKILESMGKDVIERVRAKELKGKALEAVKLGGSSYRGMSILMTELAQLKACGKRTSTN